MMGPVFFPPEQLVWTCVLDGAEVAVLSGDPEAAGAQYLIRFRTAREIAVPAHWHPEDEHVTVLQGPFALGLGDRYDKGDLRDMPAGSYLHIRRGERHFALYGQGTVVQVNGTGPFVSYYVDADQDLGDRVRSPD